MSRRLRDIGAYRTVGRAPSVSHMSSHDTAQLTAVTPGTAPAGTGVRRASSVRRPLVVAGAAAAAFLIWMIAVPALGADLVVRETPGSATTQVSGGAVLSSALVAGFLGWALLAALERRTRLAATLWRCIAAAVALVSLAGPLGLAVSGTGVLLGLHVVVAGILLVALPGRSTRSQGPGRPASSG